MYNATPFDNALSKFTCTLDNMTANSMSTWRRKV